MKYIKIKILLICIFYWNVNYSQCFLKKSNKAINKLRIYSNINNKDLDELITLIHRYVGAIAGIDKMEVGFYEDNSAPNVMASTSTNPNYHGSILIGITLLNNYLNEYGRGNTQLNLFFTLAHEYGHILQYKYAENLQLWETTKLNELQADFIAGSIMSIKYLYEIESLKKRLDKNLSDSKKNEIIKTYSIWFVNVFNQLFEKLGDTNFGSRNHHGTGNERINAFYSGLNYALKSAISKKNDKSKKVDFQLSIVKIWNQSIKYVNKL